MNQTVSRKLLRLAAAVVTLQVVYVFFFVFPGHEPKPNGLQIGTVGTQSQVAEAERQVDGVLPGVDGVRFGTAREARRAVQDREIYGAFVFSPDGKEQVLTAPAASFTVSSSLTQAAVQAQAEPVEVVPLTDGDPRGTVFNLLIVPLVVTGLLGAQLAYLLIKDSPVRHRLPIVGGVAALSGLAIATLVGPVLGALPGTLSLVAAAFALTVFGLLTIGGGLIRLLGPAGLAIGFAIFLMIGNPAAGAATAPALLPSPWAEVGQALPPGALASALRSIAYFDGAGIALPATALGLAALLGIGLELLADRRSAARGVAA